jgi:hypothetical protein
MERRDGKYGRPRTIVTEGLRAYSAAMREVATRIARRSRVRLNSRAENSHQSFRRRERAMQRFRSMKTLQKFSSVHAQVHNYFNQERHIVTRQVYKQRRSAALAEWRAACRRSPIAGRHVALCVDDRRYFDKALFPDLGGEHRAKLVPPKTDRVMADVDHALGQEILDVAQRQRVLTYIITTRRIASGELLKYRNGLPQPDTARKFALKLPCNPLQASKCLLDGLPLPPLRFSGRISRPEGGKPR